MARVAGHSAASVALHRSLGFEEVGTLREAGRKFDRWVDVRLMQLMLQETVMMMMIGLMWIIF